MRIQTAEPVNIKNLLGAVLHMQAVFGDPPVAQNGIAGPTYNHPASSINDTKQLYVDLGCLFHHLIPSCSRNNPSAERMPTPEEVAAAEEEKEELEAYLDDPYVSSSHTKNNH
jgi:hypothetical protein